MGRPWYRHRSGGFIHWDDWGNGSGRWICHGTYFSPGFIRQVRCYITGMIDNPTAAPPRKGWRPVSGYSALVLERLGIQPEQLAPTPRLYKLPCEHCDGTFTLPSPDRLATCAAVADATGLLPDIAEIVASYLPCAVCEGFRDQSPEPGRLVVANS